MPTHVIPCKKAQVQGEMLASMAAEQAAQCVIVKRRGQKVNKHFRLGASIQKEFDD